jgi:thiosulfate/3-mercaptopyruvate sulfurtransferase
MDILVDGNWLEEHLDDKDVVVVDCGVRFQPPLSLTSGHGDWSTSHIPGSVFVDHFELVDAPSEVPFAAPRPVQLARALEAVGISDDSRVVIYDRSDGSWAARLWWMIRSVGHADVALLDGGWTAWTRARRLVTSQPSLVSPGHVTVRAPLARFVGKAEVVAAMGDGATAIVSALPAKAHERGDYGRPGRIPGSRCVPSETLVDPETNQLAPVEDIRRRFNAELAADSVITYCGGGVAASLAAFALTRVGQPHVCVYDGSLLEWCAYPALPLEPMERRSPPPSTRRNGHLRPEK